MHFITIKILISPPFGISKKKRFEDRKIEGHHRQS